MNTKNDGLGIAFGAFETVDEVGRDGKNLGWFSTAEAAKKAAAGHGWYGGNGNVSIQNTITVNGLTYLLANVNPIKVDDSDEKRDAKRKEALKKLTPEERNALGFE